MDKRFNLTLQEAADLYGVSTRTLRRRIADGSLPAVRIGPRAIRVSADDVAALAKPIPSAAPKSNERADRIAALRKELAELEAEEGHGYDS